MTTTTPSLRSSSPTRLALALASLVICAVVLGACATGGKLRGRALAIKDKNGEISERAKRCAPKELAISESSVEFGLYELNQGDFTRARRHLDLAERNFRLADKLSDFEECRVQDVKVVGRAEPAPTIKKAEPTPQDRDGDGLNDPVDKCPDNPEDFDGFEDEDGCPEADNDGDGIADNDDRCPDEAEDKDDYQDRDGCPDLDNDGDGLADSRDSCTIRPEDLDGFEDDDGCPDPDNDQDKIVDVLDECPMEPEDYDNDRDEDGCKDALAKIVGKRIILGQKVFFKYNKAKILPKSFPLLNEVATILSDNPKIAIRIEGHTDSRGSARYNKRLSRKRAASVLKYLRKQGISRGRMASKGYGEERPIEDNNTDAGRAANRRVEIHITR